MHAHGRRLLFHLLGMAATATATASGAVAAAVPSLDTLASHWIDPTKPVSKHIPEQLGADQRDLPIINNFWGSVGIAPEGTRPVDLFGVNSLELPPFAGCGANTQTAPCGCGSLTVAGEAVAATGTRWSAYEARRRSDPLPGSGVVIESATRMGFEQNTVMWAINFTNPKGSAQTLANVTFVLASMVTQYSTVGTWVYAVPTDPAQFNYTSSPVAGRQAILSTHAQPIAGDRHARDQNRGDASTRPPRPTHGAASRMAFVGSMQPDIVHTCPHAPPKNLACDLVGVWVQDATNERFNITMTGQHSFNLNISAADAKRNGWLYGVGTLSDDRASFTFAYFRPNTSPGSHGWVHESGRFNGDCQHVTASDSSWHRPLAPPSPSPSPTPSARYQPHATFSQLTVPANGVATIYVVMSIAVDRTGALALEEVAAKDLPTFAQSWAAAADSWQARWVQAFTPSNGYFSGHLPTLAFPPSVGVPAAEAARNAGVARVFYMTILTAFSMLRTNLPLVFERVFVNGQGNLGFQGAKGIGGSRSWWWDEALTSTMFALLEPEGRAPTLQAWLNHDVLQNEVFGHGLGNGYAMDCEPLGSGGCTWPGKDTDKDTAKDTAKDAAKDADPTPPARPRRRVSDTNDGVVDALGGAQPRPAQPSGSKNTPTYDTSSTSASVGMDGGNMTAPQYGFYCYNPWAYYMTMSNHLRINNDTAFLMAVAANTSQTVEQALQTIVMDWQEYLIPGTQLVDYGPSMDGFSPTYKHVMPGCSQGNNIWMLRDFARLSDAVGATRKAAELRSLAKGLAKDTIAMMYTAREGKGWFNVVSPDAGNTTHVVAHEMRHVVDYFSVVFGMCGLTEECDLTDTMRRELGDWYRQESVTSTWIRATSPHTNCSNTWVVPINGTGPPPSFNMNENNYPALSTCAAGRPDHGSNGAYPSWPAFGCEALCYVDGNCSSAFQIMSLFADNTYEGPFGQAHEVPQNGQHPYTPYNDEKAFKPVAGVTRYMGIEGGSFFDAIVRGFFGYHPAPMWGSGDATAQLEASLMNTSGYRGFAGTLSNLRTPFGLAQIESGVHGLSIRLQ